MTPLFAMSAIGKILQWETWTEDDVVVFRHGYLDGIRIESRTRVESTNVGRKNQRLPKEQALFESQAAWNKKLNRQGYFLTVEEAQHNQVYYPMLAHNIWKDVRREGQVYRVRRAVTYPCWAQPKLNGVRCVAFREQDRVILRSRKGLEWVVTPHINRALLALDVGDIVDGELYVPGVPLQDLCSWVKRAQPASEKVQFHIFDLPFSPHWKVNEGAPWHDRLHALCHMDLQKPLICVPSTLVWNEEEVKAIFTDIVKAGGEGVILRQDDGIYHWADRSTALLKYKTFQDSEYRVLSMEPREVISDDGTSITICDTCTCRAPRGTFKVVPRGSLQQKQEYWEDREFFMNYRLVVRYLEKSTDGIPVGNPVGLFFRLEEDDPQDEEEDADE